MTGGDPTGAGIAPAERGEFRSMRDSSVGALGLMQLMPGTAQDVSGWLGEPYDRARLTRLGLKTRGWGRPSLDYLDRPFGASPCWSRRATTPSVPAACVDCRAGRIRAPRVWDVVDWFEHIPFEETRNYVMRVTEIGARLRSRAGRRGRRHRLQPAYLKGGEQLTRPVAAARLPMAAHRPGGGPTAPAPCHEGSLLASRRLARIAKPVAAGVGPLSQKRPRCTRCDHGPAPDTARVRGLTGPAR